MTKICPECGADFIPHNGRQVFCSVEHKRAFHRLMANRGQALLPLALAWRDGSRGGCELAKWSRTQKDGLLGRWNREDREAGRNPALVAGIKRAAKWSYVDLV